MKQDTLEAELLSACEEALDVLILANNLGRLDNTKKPGQLSKPYEKALRKLLDIIEKAKGDE